MASFRLDCTVLATCGRKNSRGFSLELFFKNSLSLTLRWYGLSFLSKNSSVAPYYLMRGVAFGAMVSKSFVGLYKFPLLVYVCLHERHVSLAFFFLPEKPLKIPVNEINRRPENHLEHFVAISWPKRGCLQAANRTSAECFF